MSTNQPDTRKTVAAQASACRAQLEGSNPIRRGFTLTELLVVITIIGMLAGISLGALYAARESAKVARTQSTISKLDILVQARIDEFLSRRIPVDMRWLPTDPVDPITGKRNRIPPRVAAEFRLRAIRYLMKMEMPDRVEDIVNPKPSIDSPKTISVSLGGRTWTREMKRTAVARSMYRRFNASPPTSEYDIAEVFYLWVTTGDRDAVEQFQPNEIGDVDGDGYPEFVDGWGMPIQFIRWPVGFVDESELMTGDESTDHDPYDPRNIDGAAFRTVPLIWSFGPDKINGIGADSLAYEWDKIYSRDGGRPFDASHPQFGAEAGHHHDNIHNHTLGMN
jgi:prepilin-type N-terminal cleavage/methylation domain-containing protein